MGLFDKLKKQKDTKEEDRQQTQQPGGAVFIPRSLKEFGVPESDLDWLVDAGMQVTRLLVNNRRKVTPEDARKIYLEIM